MSTTTKRSDYLLGTRTIDHTTCHQGASGSWYPNFGAGFEMFGWEHDHPAVEHTPGCNGSGIVGFDTAANAKGQLHITRYHYCRVPVRQHHTTTTEGPTCP